MIPVILAAATSRCPRITTWMILASRKRRGLVIVGQIPEDSTADQVRELLEKAHDYGQVPVSVDLR